MILPAQVSQSWTHGNKRTFLEPCVCSGCAEGVRAVSSRRGYFGVCFQASDATKSSPIKQLDLVAGIGRLRTSNNEKTPSFSAESSQIAPVLPTLVRGKCGVVWSQNKTLDPAIAGKTVCQRSVGDATNPIPFTSEIGRFRRPLGGLIHGFAHRGRNSLWKIQALAGEFYLFAGPVGRHVGSVGAGLAF